MRLAAARKKQRSRRAGFTLLELVIAATVTGIVGVGLTQGLNLANNTHRSVTSKSEANRQVRAAVKVLRSEMQSTNSGSIAITTDALGNHQLDFQVPVDGVADIAWGAYDRALGTMDSEWNREGWHHRYVVLPDGNGGQQLVRQILDLAAVVQDQTTLCTNLLTNNDVGGPGFTVQQTGSVWEVQLVTRKEASDGARADSFHVRLRN